MNRPKSTRKTHIVPLLGKVPTRVGPNNKKKNRQPNGYGFQHVHDPRFNHSLRHAENKANNEAYNG